VLEYHLDHRVVLDQKPEFKNLYKWSLQELDADGKKIGRDEIPWQWDLYFTATELVLSDTLRIAHEYRLDSDDTKLVTRTNRFIRGKLQPGSPVDHPYSRPSYSMLGTTRTILSFELTIEGIAGADAEPTCRAWAGLSYTADVDFRDETFDDTIVFQLYVPSAAFADYARKIETGTIRDAIFNVGGVDGFYSDWSPSISTDHIKVLTDHKEHKVEMPSDCEIDPPRVGRVNQAELYLRCINKLDGLPSEPDEDWVEKEVAVDTASASSVSSVVLDGRTTALLSSVRFAVWIIAALLLLLMMRRVLV
jgi:hypothetical protein